MSLPSRAALLLAAQSELEGLLGELERAGWTLVREVECSERSFAEYLFVDEEGEELLLREDQILGQRLLIGPSALLRLLARSLSPAQLGPTLEQALAEALAAATPTARVATLGPLCALLGELGADTAALAPAQLSALLGLLEERLQDEVAAVRRAALLGVAYCLQPQVGELLQTLSVEPALQGEVARQLQIRRLAAAAAANAGAASDASDDEERYLAQAEELQASGQLLGGLCALRVALALARRQGLPLRRFLVPLGELQQALVADGAAAAVEAELLTRGAGALLRPLSLLLMRGRLYEAEEVAAALLEELAPLSVAAPLKLPLQQALATALAERGRGDLAAPILRAALALCDQLLAAQPSESELWLMRAALMQRLDDGAQ